MVLSRPPSVSYTHLVQPQLVAGGDAATHQVALFACFGELVVELSGLEPVSYTHLPRNGMAATVEGAFV